MSQGYNRRLGIQQHIQAGTIDLLESGIHDFLLLQLNVLIGGDFPIPAGIVFTSALAIHAYCKKRVSLRAVQRILRHLEKIGWIKTWPHLYKGPNYPMLICRAAVYDEAGNEYRVNGPDTTSWQYPVYEPVVELWPHCPPNETEVSDELVRKNGPTLLEAKSSGSKDAGRESRAVQAESGEFDGIPVKKGEAKILQNQFDKFSDAERALLKIGKRSSEFGRWNEMEDWISEVSTIGEKLLPLGSDEAIPVEGRWAVSVEIPSRVEDCYGSAMEDGLALLTAVGMRPEEAYLERGFCVLSLGSAPFYDARRRAEQIRTWLEKNNYQPVFHDDRPWEPGDNPSAVAKIKFALDGSFVHVQGDWKLSVIIPEEFGGQEEGHRLAADLEVAASEEGKRVGGWLFDFHIGDYALAKVKAQRTVSHFVAKGYQVQRSWGDPDLQLDSVDEESLRAANSTGHAFHKFGADADRVHVDLRDKNGNHSLHWSRRVKRLATRLTGPGNEIDLRLTCQEAKLILDLAGEFGPDYSLIPDIVGHCEHKGLHVSRELCDNFSDAGDVGAALEGIAEKLRASL
jgi:hypothetical protein